MGLGREGDLDVESGGEVVDVAGDMHERTATVVGGHDGRGEEVAGRALVDMVRLGSTRP